MFYIIFLQIEIVISSLLIIWLVGWWQKKSLLWLSFIFLISGQIIITLFGLGYNLAKLFYFWPNFCYLVVIAIEVFLLFYFKKIKETKKFLHNLKLDWPLVTLLLIFIVFACLSLRILDFSGDGLMYHLPSVPQWHQSNSIYRAIELPDYWRNNIWAFYPHNIHLLYLWAFELTGSPAYFKIVHYIFLIIVAMVLYYAAKEQKYKFALLAPLGLFLTPIIINSAQVGSVDIEVGVLLFGALFALFNYFDKQESRYLMLSALSFGLLFGAKLNAFVYFGLAIISLALILIFYKAKDYIKNWRAWLWYGLAVLVFTLIFNFQFLYINFITNHSYIYPFDVLLKFKEVILSQPKDWLVYLYGDDSYQKIAGVPMYNYDSGVGIILASLGVASLFGLLVEAWRKKEYKFYIFILPIVFLSLFLFLEKRPVFLLARYYIFAILCLLFALPWLLNKLKLKNILVYSLFSFLAVYSLILSLPTIFNYTTLAYGKSFYGDLMFNKINPYKQRGDLATQNYKEQWAWLNNHTVNNAATILPVHQIFTYDLYGYNLQNKLINIFSTDRSDFFKKLKSADTSLIFLSTLNTQDKLRITKNGNNFELITDNANADQFNVIAEVNRRGQNLIIDYDLSDKANAKYFIGINGMQHLSELTDSGKFIFKLDGMNVKTLGLFVFDKPTNQLTMAHLGIKIKSVKLDNKFLTLDFKISDYPLEYYWVNNLPLIFNNIYQLGEVYVYEINQTTLDGFTKKP